jgi:hypothetical protein
MSIMQNFVQRKKEKRKKEGKKKERTVVRFELQRNRIFYISENSKALTSFSSYRQILIGRKVESEEMSYLKMLSAAKNS